MSDDEGVGSSQLIMAAQVPLNELVPGKIKDNTKNRGHVSISSYSYDCFHIQNNNVVKYVVR